MFKIKFKNLILVFVLVLWGSSLLAQTEQDTTVRMNQYGKIVSRTHLDGEARNGIMVFESKDQKMRYWFDSRVYFDGMIGLGEPLNEIGNGVDIRRARFAMKANVNENWYGEIDVDFAGGMMELKDMVIKYEPANWGVKMGHFKEGFSMETTTTSRFITFIERSLVSKMAPSRHLGVQGFYYNKLLLAQGGIHFRTIGEMDENVWAQDANKNFGTDDGYSFTGRLAIRPFNEMGKMLHIGVAASYRTPKTSAEIENSYRFSSRSLTSINRKKYIDTDDILNVDNNILFNTELAASWKNIMLHGEMILNKINRTQENGGSAQIGGGFVQAGILLFGGQYVYNSTEGEFTQIDRGRNNKDLELAFRFDYMNANDFDAKIYGGAANGYTVALNYYLSSNVKLMLNYSYLDHDRYANGRGKLYIYKDEQGNLYKDPFEYEIPTGKGGDDFSIISARIEIDF